MSSNIETLYSYEIDKESILELENSLLGVDQISIINYPQFGTLELGESKFKYKPTNDFIGNDFFSFNSKSNAESIVTISVKETVFKPRARLLLQLGDQLIKNENIALLELVKNSYDANAKNVTVLMGNVDDKNIGVIQIEDDGDGMDKDIVTNAWMEPGSDSKAKKVTDLIGIDRSRIIGRIPIGEKGIGRFGVHKLGYVIEMFTKKEGKKEVQVKIDWRDFEHQRYLSDVPVQINENKHSVHFKNGKTGTFIHIENLRSNWNRRMVREAYRAIGSLTSPFDNSIYSNEKEQKEDFFHISEIENDEFNIHFEVEVPSQDNWLKDLTKFEDFPQKAFYRFYAEIEDDEISTFNYKFTPWYSITSKKDIKTRSLDKSDKSISNHLKLVRKENRKERYISLKNQGIGKVKIRGLVFDLSTSLNKFGLEGTKKSLNEYLKSNGGVRVFRDGMRIYDYGENDADWLGLDIKRVNAPTSRLSNNLLIVEVHLDRLESFNLKEKTNREGFVENHVFELFRDAVSHTLNIFSLCRNPDKTKLREVTGLSIKSEPVLAVIEDTRKYIRTEIPELKEIQRKKLLYNLNKIENDYKELNDILQTAAGAGLNMSVVVHEIEKILKEIQLVLKAEKVSQRVVSLITHVEKLVDGYTTLIRRSGIKKVDLKQLINDSLFNVSYRMKAHQISIVKEFENIKNSIIVSAAPNLLLGGILNIIDNSIYWIEKSGRKEKKIFINIEKDEYYTHLIIADNGTGFTIPKESITKPLVFGKIGGMGLGLHITNEIILGMKGTLLFPDWGEYDIPEEFKMGAVNVIQFKNIK